MKLSDLSVRTWDDLGNGRYRAQVTLTDLDGTTYPRTYELTLSDIDRSLGGPWLVLCRHCEEPKSTHVHHKCLFSPSTWTAVTWRLRGLYAADLAPRSQGPRR